MAGAAVELEQSILKPETFTEKATEIIKTQIPLQNQALCGWIFTHVRNLIEHYEHNKLTGKNNTRKLKLNYSTFKDMFFEHFVYKFFKLG